MGGQETMPINNVEPINIGSTIIRLTTYNKKFHSHLIHTRTERYTQGVVIVMIHATNN